MSNVSFKQRGLRLFRRAGIDVRRSAASFEARLVRLLDVRGVDVVIDVGAHTGGYASALRENGYRGRILSFEPNPAAFLKLTEMVKRDPEWKAYELGLGSSTGMASLTITANEGASSSFLPMLASHMAAAPEAVPTHVVRARVAKLNDFVSEIERSGEKPFLKLDVQGFEKHVLDGGADIVRRLVGIQMELSLEPLYDGAVGFVEGIELLQSAGFNLVQLIPGFVDQERHTLLQCDGVFVRPE